MYTAFQLKCKLKPEFIPMINDLYILRSQTSSQSDENWTDLSNKYPYPEVVDYALDLRADFIPFGKGGFEVEPFDEEGVINDVWQFSCTLKDYENTIDHFIQTIIPLVAQSIEICESWYEEDDAPQQIIPQLNTLS